MSDRIFSRPNAEIAWSEAGDGPTFLAAHGMTSSRLGDARYGTSFTALAERGRRFVSYDARGHGMSTGRAVPEDYAWPNLADDMLALMTEIGGDEPIDASGASMGCATLLAAAVKSPDRFRRLVLVIPPTAWETRAAQAGNYELGAGAIESLGLAAFGEMMAGQPIPPVLAELSDQPATPDVSEVLLPSVLRGAALSNLPAREILATLQHPTLILAWVDDPVHPLSTAEQLNDLLPNSELLIASHASDLPDWLDAIDRHISDKQIIAD